MCPSETANLGKLSTRRDICATSKGGLELLKLYDLQGKIHVKQVMEVLHTKTVKGNLLDCSLQEILPDSDCSFW